MKGDTQKKWITTRSLGGGQREIPWIPRLSEARGSIVKTRAVSTAMCASEQIILGISQLFFHQWSADCGVADFHAVHWFHLATEGLSSSNQASRHAPRQSVNRVFDRHHRHRRAGL